MSQKELIESSNRDQLLSTPGHVPGHITIPIPSRSDSTSPSSYAATQASRTRLLSATDKLTDGQRRLEDSHRMALETEQVGSGILNDLRSQRETLVHTRDNVNQFTLFICDNLLMVCFALITALRSRWFYRSSVKFIE